VMFLGVDGRIFSSSIPEQLNAPQFYLLNLLKGNLQEICGQLKMENLRVSFQQYKEGTMIISGVGDHAFMVSLIAGEVDITGTNEIIMDILKASAVLKHIFEQRSMDEETLSQYPENVANELKKLTRRLFKERFETTREYQKNSDILKYIKKKLAGVVSVGEIDAITTLTFNELGTTAPYMNDKLWGTFLEKVINDHIRRTRGDLVADDCYKTWTMELHNKLKSYI